MKIKTCSTHGSQPHDSQWRCQVCEYERQLQSAKLVPFTDPVTKQTFYRVQR